MFTKHHPLIGFCMPENLFSDLYTAATHNQCKYQT